jgi:hypothetical protein
LKIYISALHYSPQSEVEICFPLLIRYATNAHYFPTLPKLVRLAIAVKSVMDPKPLNTLSKHLITDLIESHRKLPASVVGQICRIISELSESLDPMFGDFLLQLFWEYSGSVFVRREIINLIRSKPEIAGSSMMQTIETDPSLMSVWDPSSLLN